VGRELEAPQREPAIKNIIDVQEAIHVIDRAIEELEEAEELEEDEDEE
jgi:hypothetical protein